MKGILVISGKGGALHASDRTPVISLSRRRFPYCTSDILFPLLFTRRAAPAPTGSTRKLVVLSDNEVSAPGTAAEHGWAVWIQAGERRMLFDTGQSTLLLANARALGIDLKTLDTMVLSHGHYDHVGGLAGVLAQARGGVHVYLHPDATLLKYRRTESGTRYIGMPESCRHALHAFSTQTHPVTAPTEIAPGMFVTGEIPRVHPEEEGEEGFCLDAAGLRKDPFTDDLALFMRTSAGTVVLLGCAHAGVINTLEHIRKLEGGRPFHAVIGGMHLRSASASRLSWTLDALRDFSIENIYPAHCTGAPATAALREAFPERCPPCGVGMTWTL